MIDPTTVTSGGAWSLAWRLMRTHGRLYAGSMALWIAFHSMPLTTGLATRWVFNRLELEQSLAVAFAALAAAEALRVAVMYGASLVWSANWMMLASILRANLLDWIVRRRGPAQVNRTTGEQVSRFRDDAEEFVWLIDTWLDVSGTLTFTLIGLVVLFRIDPLLAGIVIAPLSVIVISTRFFGERMKQYAQAARRTTAMVTGFVGEVFGSVQAIKVAGAEPQVLGRLRRLGDQRRTAAIRDRLSFELINAVNQNAVHLAIALVMILGAGKLRSGELRVGDLTIFFSYVTGMSVCPRFLGHLLYRQRQAAVSAERMLDTLDAAPVSVLVQPAELHLRSTPPPLPPRHRAPGDELVELEASGLTHVFASSHHGVRDVSFVLPAGSFTVVTGPVGSGKTTLLRVLLGLLPDDAGEVRWNGEVVADRGAFLVPPRAAYTAQVPRLFSESIADNVLLGREDPSGERLADALRRAVLEDDVADLERGIDTLIGPRGLRLSGGQVQRVAAARMLAQDAGLLVFDDLSSALDVETERQLWERLLGDAGAWRPTCLVVSHRPAVLRRADLVLVLDDGVLVGSGSLREVRRVLSTVG